MKNRPLVLISNDDGIKAGGLKSIAMAVSEFAEVVVAAPSTQQSGKSHAISIHGSLTAREVSMPGIKAYSINGTPADCVKLGLFSLCKKKPALVISGINHGPNFGKFIIYSGTIGAATEAALLGIPALSISLDDYYSKEPDFSRAACWGAGIAGMMCRKEIKAGKHTIINVNIPGPGCEKIRGIKVIPRDQSEYEEFFREKRLGRRTLYTWHIDERKRRNTRGIADTDAVRLGYVAVTPLHFELTDHVSMKKLKAQFKSVSFR